MNLLTPSQAAAYLQMHVVTVYRLVKEGKIPYVRFGGSIRIPKDRLDIQVNQSSS